MSTDKIIADLLVRIDAFLVKHQMADSRFGTMAVNDPSVISRLREGREPRSKTIKRLNSFMDDYENN